MSLLNNAIVQILPIFPKSFIHLFSKRYVAGATLGEAVDESVNLNARNMSITMDVLGENITHLDEASAAKNNCLDILDEIKANKINGNISIKVTQLGLKLDKSACKENVQEIVERAKQYNNFVRLDMEDSSCTDDTLEICFEMRKIYENVGTVIQAYLKRSETDVKMLAENGINLRICKGIYTEPAEIAFKSGDEIRDNFIRLIKIMLEEKVFVGIATHDPWLVDQSYAILKQLQTPKDRYEFQMLLGVSENLRSRIIARGHPLRVYVPFGEQWYPYSMRRLKENPKMAGYIIKNTLLRN